MLNYSESYQFDAQLAAESLLGTQKAHGQQHQVGFEKLLRASDLFHHPAAVRVLARGYVRDQTFNTLLLYIVARTCHHMT